MLNFLAQYFRDPRGVGAIAPSSPALARAMVDAVDPDAARVVVEYGPGTGVFTAELIARRRPGTRIVAIELNPDFHRVLADRFRDVADFDLVRGSAADVASIVAGLGIGRVDHVLSGLPLSSLPADVGEAILTETANLLGKHGRFLLFQYSRYRRAMIARHFRHIASRHVLANLPPAYVFACDNRAATVFPF
jgi:phosphatidylethanolamine/phosphatidyl-N-methylethanolamine N-methyltransferase